MKIERLKLTGYQSLKDLKDNRKIGSIVLAANPDSVVLNHSVSMESGNDAGKYSGETQFSFILDGTGALYDSNKTVAQQVEYLKKITIAYDQEKKSSCYVKVEWGNVFSGIGSGDASTKNNLGFKGKVTSLRITYNLFSSKGEPLRAKADISVQQRVDLSSSGRMSENLNFTSEESPNLDKLKKELADKMKNAYAKAMKENKAALRQK